MQKIATFNLQKNFMRKTGLIITIYFFASIAGMAQSNNSHLLAVKDSTMRAKMHADSLKIEDQFAEKIRWQSLENKEEFPVINAGKFSGVFPVTGITEVPDPKMQYKLLFEIKNKNPDSLLNEPDQSLVEVARIINLHVASGIPLKNISIVMVMHGYGLYSICTNDSYQKRFKMNNPNLKLISDLEKLGARFIACGQAMNFLDIKNEELLPVVKVSFTAQTALSGYQLKGYVLKTVEPDK
ncbi:MAG TPA: DsrE family protein [Hanamia sp.]